MTVKVTLSTFRLPLIIAVNQLHFNAHLNEMCK